LIQAREELLCFVPGNEVRWKIVALEVHRIAAQYGFPLALRHFVPPHEESFADIDLMNWFLVSLAIFRTHHETARRE